MKVAVLGAGVSGLSVARMLQDKGHEIVLYEKEATAGGLARTRFSEGYLYDPYGGHIFNSKDSKVVEWVFGICPKENWQYTERNAKIYFHDRYVSYPFELSLCELDKEDALTCVYDFMMAGQGDEPDNFRDWLTWKFGQGIADAYMIPYNEKIWAYPLEDMETQWMQGKMPLPEKKEMLRSVLFQNPKERKMPHSTFYYPKKGGIQSMVDAIADGLTIQYDSTIERIEKIKDKWYINGEGEYDRVISTIPLVELPDLMQLPECVVEHIKGLRYNSLTTVLFACEKTDITWLYVPSHAYRAHRVGYQSALTPYACGGKSGGCAALEIIGDAFDVDESFAKRKDILPKALGFKRVIDWDFAKYAYVIHDKHYRKNLAVIQEYFGKDNSFSLLGRWGTWNYKNMDLCIQDAMELVRGF